LPYSEMVNGECVRHIRSNTWSALRDRCPECCLPSLVLCLCDGISKPTFEMSQINSILGSKRKAYESVMSTRWEEIKKTCEWYVELSLDLFIPVKNKETR
jgi:hypothetical protein